MVGLGKREAGFGDWGVPEPLRHDWDWETA